jgi:hypothetical protein
MAPASGAGSAKNGSFLPFPGSLRCLHFERRRRQVLLARLKRRLDQPAEVLAKLMLARLWQASRQAVVRRQNDQVQRLGIFNGPEEAEGFLALSFEGFSLEGVQGNLALVQQAPKAKALTTRSSAHRATDSLMNGQRDAAEGATLV